MLFHLSAFSLTATQRPLERYTAELGSIKYRAEVNQTR